MSNFFLFFFFKFRLCFKTELEERMGGCQSRQPITPTPQLSCEAQIPACLQVGRERGGIEQALNELLAEKIQFDLKVSRGRPKEHERTNCT